MRELDGGGPASVRDGLRAGGRGHPRVVERRRRRDRRGGQAVRDSADEPRRLQLHVVRRHAAWVRDQPRAGVMPPGFATSHAQTSATRPAVPAAPSMNFLPNVSTTSAMSRVPMSALLSWLSECRPAAVAAPSAARRTGAHGCWRD